MCEKNAQVHRKAFSKMADSVFLEMRSIWAKKFLSLFLIAAMLFSVTACGTGNDLSGGDLADGGSTSVKESSLTDENETVREDSPDSENKSNRDDSVDGEGSSGGEDFADRENASVKTESEGTGDVADLELAKDTTAFDQTTGISGWHQFFQKSFYQVISKAQDDNCIYSPVNLYLCLAMLSEISDGDTRTQITNLLGQDNQKKIRRQSQELFWDASRVVTCPVGEPEPEYDYRSELGNSMWLNETVPFQKKVIKKMMKTYYVDCAEGEMGTEAMDKKIQRWLNEKTNGKLKEQVNSVHTNANTVMMLLSSIHFESAWKNPFSKKKIKEGVFHGVISDSAQGGVDSENGRKREITCDFLHQKLNTNVVKTEDYMAIELPMQNGVSMHIILPEEGSSVKKILEKNRKEDLLALCVGYNEETEYARVDFSMPKFRIDSALKMDGVLKELGVTDMFEMGKADFSTLTGREKRDTGIYHDKAPDFYVSGMDQAGNMMVDENGCSVASYTEVSLESKALPPEKEYEMCCDRPFLFSIVKNDMENDIRFPIITGVIQTVPAA